MNKTQTFWEHLDELRGSIIRIAVVTVICGITAFFFKDELFSIILAPKNSDFITYKLFGYINEWISPSGNGLENISVSLINTRLADQFFIHMKMAFYAGFLFASPYALFLIFRFISPALIKNEKKYALRVAGSGYIMFILGVLLSYMLIFPLTFRFLGTYQVSTEIENTITLHSYIDTMLILNLMMGIIFEIPVLCWLFAKLGFLSADFMKRYRKHAVILILIIAAIITPTADVFTLLLVSAPIYLLYEVSISIVKKVNRIKGKELVMA